MKGAKRWLAVTVIVATACVTALGIDAFDDSWQLPVTFRSVAMAAIVTGFLASGGKWVADEVLKRIDAARAHADERFDALTNAVVEDRARFEELAASTDEIRRMVRKVYDDGYVDGLARKPMRDTANISVVK